MTELLASLGDIYPNPVFYLYGHPLFVFRDHRWTLPVLYAASVAGMLTLPATLISFDRHPDALEPVNGTVPLEAFRRDPGTVDDLAALVRDHLSPRDDDWIISGMELGIIGDIVRFISSGDPGETVAEYRDRSGAGHMVYRLGMLSRELCHKGALADPAHPAARAGLWDRIGWHPEAGGIERTGAVLDIDLDFFTLSWERYTIPFPDEVYEGEFLLPCQSLYYNDYLPVMLLRDLALGAPLATVATEPRFCGGSGKARRILDALNDLLFERELVLDRIAIDYRPSYPDA